MRTAASLSIAFALLAATPASASYDPVGSGTTTVSLAPEFRAALAGSGAKLIARDGARLRGSSVSFPVATGRLDPQAARGKVEHSGSLVFVAGKRRLPLRELTFKPAQASSPLSAKFGGGQLKLASSSRLSIRRAGFGLRGDVRRIALSAKVATRLAKKLRLRGVFHEGQAFGSAVTVVQPATVAILSTGRASFAPAAAFMAKLDDLFVSLNPIAPAELALGPVFTFPIAIEGALAPNGSAGTLRLGGALEFLQLGRAQLFWNEPWLDLGTGTESAEAELLPSPPNEGKVGRVGLLAVDRSAAAVSQDPKARTITFGAPLGLPAATAASLNRLFAEGQAVFQAGEPVGSVSFVAQAQ